MARFSLSRTTPPIVLLTDFGFRDSYVGVMKGVIYKVCRSADVIDLSHNIMPHDVAEAAFVLNTSYRYFPPETIFVCVVDPGVGTDRPVLCMRSQEQTFIAPDNGLLSIISDEHGYDTLIRVTESQYFLQEQTSATFHGRDIFAPVAAHLAAGLELEKLGRPVRAMRRLRLPKPVRTPDGTLRGEVIYIDQFGNLITNISADTLERTMRGTGGAVEVNVKRGRIATLSETYGSGEEGDLVALVGSSGFLEVAVNQGSAARTLGCEKGDTVTVTPQHERV
jgi:S-adenosylmethionine hydrolase